MKQLLFFLVILGLCMNAASANAQSRKKQVKKKSTSKSKPAAKQKDMLAMLQGRWASIEDQKTFFEVKGDQQINIYGKDVLDTSSINFYNDYPVNIAETDTRKSSGNYMVVSKGKDHYIYSIDVLTTSRLALMYLPRGNMLNYRKVR